MITSMASSILSNSLIQGILAITLTIGIILCYLLTGTIPEILSYSLASAIAFWFGSSTSEIKLRNLRNTGQYPKVIP